MLETQNRRSGARHAQSLVSPAAIVVAPPPCPPGARPTQGRPDLGPPLSFAVVFRGNAKSG